MSAIANRRSFPVRVAFTAMAVLSSMQVLAACHERIAGVDTTPRRTGEALQTDALYYDAPRVDEGWLPPRFQRRFQVVATYTNRTQETVYIDTCRPDASGPIYGITIAGKENSPRYSIFSPIWGCVGHDQHIAVPPGASRTDTLTISGPNEFDHFTGEPGGLLDPRLRLTYGVRPCQPESPCGATRTIVLSNIFEVRMPR
ncbi:hypothetical protein [Gemmatimonas aurantiaca]|uniref:hypothetical protein n=1 Tax=Gemmatimonas aurantiaca TaxID=173480 RepID=UPI00301CA7CE